MAHITISSITPQLGSNESPASVRITGSGFISDVRVFIGDSITGIECTNVIVANSNTITCTVPSLIVPDLYDITVFSNADTDDTDILPDAYRIMFPQPDFPYTSETQAVIKARMLEGLSDRWNVSEGTFVSDIMSAAALESARVYIRLRDAAENFFPQFARGEFLDLISEMFGLTRDIASKGIGNVLVSGIDGTNIPILTNFSTQVVLGQSTAAIVFESTTAATITGGTATVPVRALLGGSAGNVSVNQIVRLLGSIDGVSSVNNPTAIAGGTDNEDDDAFRSRFLSFVRDPVAGGNKQDYITWALEITAVGDVSVVPLGRGAGTVDVYVVDTDFVPADGGLLATVQNHIAPTPTDQGGGKAPIGADVLVLSPTTFDIDVDATIVPVSGFLGTDVINNVEAALTEFINELPIGEDVLYVRIANVIHDTLGVDNYSSLLVNAGVADITISVSQTSLTDVLTITE